MSELRQKEVIQIVVRELQGKGGSEADASTGAAPTVDTRPRQFESKNATLEFSAEGQLIAARLVNRHTQRRAQKRSSLITFLLVLAVTGTSSMLWAVGVITHDYYVVIIVAASASIFLGSAFVPLLILAFARRPG